MKLIQKNIYKDNFSRTKTIWVYNQRIPNIIIQKTKKVNESNKTEANDDTFTEFFWLAI